jgi:hypothetical protein
MDAAYSAVQHDQTVYAKTAALTFSLLLLLGADEQIFGVEEQILGQDQSD